MSVMASPLEPFRPQKRVGEVDQQPYGHEGGERVVDWHGSPLEAIADDGIADRQREKADTDGEQDEIEHERSLSKGIVRSEPEIEVAG
jgi:hypothetical protein